MAMRAHGGSAVVPIEIELSRVGEGERVQQQQKDQRTNDGYLYLAYLRQCNEGRPLDRNKSYIKFNRFCAILGAYVCDIDIMGGYESSAREMERKRRSIATLPYDPEAGEHRELAMRNAQLNKLKRNARELMKPRRWLRYTNFFRYLKPPNERSSWRQNLKWGWISQAVLVVYLVSSFILCLDVIYLYRYDVARLRMKRVKDLMQIHGSEATIVFDRGGWSATIHSIDGFGNSSFDEAPTLAEYAKALGKRMDSTREILEFLGDKFISMGIINECLYIFVLELAFIMYLAGMWIFTWINRADIHLLRDLIDCEGEARRVEEFCEREVVKVLESNRIYLLNEHSRYKHLPLPRLYSNHHHGYHNHLHSYNHLAHHHHHEKGLNLTGPTPFSRSKQSVGVSWLQTNQEMVMEKDQTSRLLMQIYESGALRPMNRWGAWIDTRNFYQSMMYFWIFFYSTLFHAGIMYAPQRNSDADFFDLSEACALYAIMIENISINFYGTSLVVACLDQAALVKRLLGIVENCIRVNERQWSLYLAVTNSHLEGLCLGESSPIIEGHEVTGGQVQQAQLSPCSARARKLLIANKLELNRIQTEIVDRINSNLLFTLMTYKIFVVQLKPLKRSLRGVMLSAFLIAVIIPIIARAHVPYLEQDSHADPRTVRLIAMMFSSLIIVPLNLVTLPICCVPSRCHKLYKAMSSLMAHISEVRQMPGGEKLYNDYAVTILLKELSHPKRFIRKFVVSALGCHGTFSTLFKFHFWWGLLALSILVDTNEDSQGEFLNGLLSDPLGVWNFHLV